MGGKVSYLHFQINLLSLIYFLNIEMKFGSLVLCKQGQPQPTTPPWRGGGGNFNQVLFETFKSPTGKTVSVCSIDAHCTSVEETDWEGWAVHKTKTSTADESEEKDGGMTGRQAWPYLAWFSADF